MCGYSAETPCKQGLCSLTQISRITHDTTYRYRVDTDRLGGSRMPSALGASRQTHHDADGAEFQLSWTTMFIYDDKRNRLVGESEEVLNRKAIIRKLAVIWLWIGLAMVVYSTFLVADERRARSLIIATVFASCTTAFLYYEPSNSKPSRDSAQDGSGS
jgi:hypothetical protein